MPRAVVRRFLWLPRVLSSDSFPAPQNVQGHVFLSGRFAILTGDVE